MMQRDFTFEHRIELEREEGKEEGSEQEADEMVEVVRSTQGAPRTMI